MPNRIIKESITTSGTLALLTDGEERHFWRLIVQADDFGYLDARPEVIRARAYPMMLDAVPVELSEARTQALVESGLLHLFTHEGKRYGHFPTWDDHQQKRAKYSKYPQVQSCEINCNHPPAYVPETLDIRSETLDKRQKTKPPWLPPEWFLPLTRLSGYKEKNHSRAAKGIEAACIESGASAELVVSQFAEKWPTLKTKYRWDDPVSTLKGTPLEIAINNSKGGGQNAVHRRDTASVQRPTIVYTPKDRTLGK